jgi:hypothetical protein
LEYAGRLENFLSALKKNSDIDFAIASGGDRMKITMDRYQANWGVVELVRLSNRKDLGVSNLAVACLKLPGFEPPEDYTPSIVEMG